MGAKVGLPERNVSKNKGVFEAGLRSIEVAKRAGVEVEWRVEDVVQPRVLDDLLSQGWLGGDPPARVTEGRQQDVKGVSSNCELMLLTLAQPPGGPLPDSVFVKLPMRPLLTRWFFVIIQSWRLEASRVAELWPV